MSTLYLYNGQLLTVQGALATSSSCCCCPQPPDMSGSISQSVSAASLSGTRYLFANGTISANIDAAAGFDPCVPLFYKCNATLKAGSYFDDLGGVLGSAFDTHKDCPNGRLTSLAADAALGVVAFQKKADGTYVIPIPYYATSSNCGPPSKVGLSLVFVFSPK